MPKGSIPVLVGVGQVVSQWDGANGPDGAPSPLSLATQASRTALQDAGIPASAIDTVAMVRIFEDSMPSQHPHGHNTNLPGTIARDLGAAPERAIYARVGGQSPQALANEMAARIYAGEVECALITGSEANKASKSARKHGVEINWADGADMAVEDRGMGDMLLSRNEIKHGLVTPAYFYALFENAMAARDGETRSARRTRMSALFTKFAAIAASNPYAQFQATRSVDFLSQPSRENYPFADPYLKWHMAQDAVNQGAAIILMSEAKADEMGVAADKRIYLHGAGEASDDFISQRPTLDGSWAMQAAIARALAQAGKASTQIDAFDLYSCFPSAVFSSLAALGIDHTVETRPLTMTGGLPFFGGPGNNYSLHAIASMADHLRAHRGDYGLVLANGGWMTKEAVGIWSTRLPETFTPVEPGAIPDTQIEICTAPDRGVVETYTVAHGKDGPALGIIFARSANGKRFIANASPEALPRLLAEDSPIGLTVQATSDREVNTVAFV